MRQGRRHYNRLSQRPGFKMMRRQIRWALWSIAVGLDGVRAGVSKCADLLGCKFKRPSVWLGSFLFLCCKKSIFKLQGEKK